eukprot:1539232-Pyramimonas_sp.AAC.1
MAAPEALAGSRKRGMFEGAAPPRGIGSRSDAGTRAPRPWSSGEAPWLAYRHTKECSKDHLWSARRGLRTFLAETVLF